MTHLRQFRNLLLDESTSFDVEAFERKLERSEHRKRQRMHNALDGIVMPISINNSLDRTSLARRLLLHDMLPAGAIGRYDIDSDAYVMNRRHGRLKIEHVVDTKELYVPTYDHVRSRIKKEETALKWFLDKEYQAFFALLEKTEQVVTDVGEITTAAINHAFRMIERHDAVAYSILVGPKAFGIIDGWGSDFYDRAPGSTRVYGPPHFRGHLYTADVYCLDHPALTNRSYVLPSVDMGGVFVNRSYMSMSGYHSEEYGMALVNPFLVSCIETV